MTADHTQLKVTQVTQCNTKQPSTLQIVIVLYSACLPDYKFMP